MTLLMVFEFLKSGGKFWFDKTFWYLGILLVVYLFVTLLVYLREDANTWLGRAPFERAATTTARMLYVVVAFVVFINMLADAPHVLFNRVFKFQLCIGILLALFGILQYIMFTVFSTTALSEIEPTNETYSLQSALIRLQNSRIFRANGVFSEPSWFGFFLTPLAVKIVVAKAKGIVIGSPFFHSICIFIVGAAIFCNFSLTALLTLSIMMAIFVMLTVLRTPKVTMIGVIIISCAVTGLLLSPLGEPLLFRLGRVLELKDASTIDRLVRAYTSIKVLIDNVWLGVGPGGYAFWYPKLGGLDFKVMASPLNTWLFILTDVGIIGFFPFIFFIGNILARALKYIKSVPLVSVYFWSVISFLILLTTLDNWYGELVWFELAILLALTSRSTSRTSDVRPAFA